MTTATHAFGGSVLFSEMTPASDWEADFNDWYDTEHIPVRMKAPGFLGAQRYQRDDGGYLVTYEMESPGALQTSEYSVIKGEPSERTAWMLDNVSGFTRHTGVELASYGDLGAARTRASMLFTVMMSVPEDELDELDGWYAEDHVPLLLGCDQWLAVRCFAVTGEPAKYNRLAIHYLESDQALHSPEREAARSTPWRLRMAERGWFNELYPSVWHQHERFHSPEQP